MRKIGVLIPCRDRHEYTQKCLESIEKAQTYEGVTFHLVNDGSEDKTMDVLHNANLPKLIVHAQEPLGLRQVVMNFFKYAQQYDYLVKVDNDCLVPEAWLRTILSVLDSGDVDIVSPNVNPSQAAFRYGIHKEGLAFRPAKTVGGLWAMKSSMVEDVDFQAYDLSGITGAYQLLNQIIVEKEARCGWLPQVTYEDIGHWSGDHPEHIKSEEHRQYSAEVGRHTAW